MYKNTRILITVIDAVFLMSAAWSIFLILAAPIGAADYVFGAMSSYPGDFDSKKIAADLSGGVSRLVRDSLAYAAVPLIASGSAGLAALNILFRSGSASTKT